MTVTCKWPGLSQQGRRRPPPAGRGTQAGRIMIKLRRVTGPGPRRCRARLAGGYSNLPPINQAFKLGKRTPSGGGSMRLSRRLQYPSLTRLTGKSAQPGFESG